MKRRHGTILIAATVLGGGLLWMLFGREPVEEGRCRLTRKKANPDSQLMGLAFQFVEPLNGKPENVRDLPAGFDHACYYQIKSGGRLVPAVVNLSRRPTLCLDTDGDGILSEERCFTPQTIRETKASSSSQRFGPVPVVSTDGSSETNGGFYVDCSRTDAAGPLTTFPVSFRTGRLRLADRTYRVAVVDGDCDGRFHSILSLPLDRLWRLPASDVFAIDLNHNGTFEISLHARSEVVPLGRLVQVEDAYYAIEIASDGMSLTLSRTEPQFGTLLIEPSDAAAELRLWSDAADQRLSQGRQWQLPAGKYKAIYAILKKTDASGDVWTFWSNLSSAFTGLGSLEFFTIKPGEATSIRIGPPFVVKADVQKTGSGAVSISPVLVGCAGEQYQADFRRNSRRAPDRMFKIVDEKGIVLVADRFKYG